MANAFQTPAQAAEVLANLVAEDALLSALVSRNFENDLMGGGKGGAPVFIKQPTTLVARSREIDDTTNSIVMDEIAESGVTINLDRKHDYSAVPLTEKDLNLNLKDFTAQVLRPQASAVVDLLEHKVAETLRSVPLNTATRYSATNPVATFTQIRKTLRENGVPLDGINVLVGTKVYADLLDAQAITDVSQSGSTAALREAGVGRVRGMNVVESLRVDDGEILAFHRDAVTLVTRAPEVPTGAAFGATIAEKGFSLRYLRDYLAEKTLNRSFVSTFSGVAILPTYKVTRSYGAATGAANGQNYGGSATVTEVPNGGIFRMSVEDAEPV
jgi:hypothetical protein